MEHPDNFPTAADYAQAAADKAAQDAKKALARVELLERVIAGDLNAKQQMLDEMTDRIAAMARPQPAGPAMDDFLKEAYSLENVRLADVGGFLDGFDWGKK